MAVRRSSVVVVVEGVVVVVEVLTLLVGGGRGGGGGGGDGVGSGGLAGPTWLSWPSYVIVSRAETRREERR